MLGKNGKQGKDSKKDESKLKAWFGDANSDAAAREKFRKVYQNFHGDNKAGTGADVLGLVNVRSLDYWTPQVPIGDGKTPFCKTVKNGKSGAAYTKPYNKIPSMHYCDRVWERDQKQADLVKDKCASLGSVMNTEKMGKTFVGFVVLHEFM